MGSPRGSVRSSRPPLAVRIGGTLPGKGQGSGAAAGMVGGHIMPPALVAAVVIAEPVALFVVVGLPPAVRIVSGSRMRARQRAGADMIGAAWVLIQRTGPGSLHPLPLSVCPIQEPAELAAGCPDAPRRRGLCPLPLPSAAPAVSFSCFKFSNRGRVFFTGTRSTLALDFQNWGPKITTGTNTTTFFSFTNCPPCLIL